MAERSMAAFLKKNAVKYTEVEAVISDRFQEGGAPVPWRIRVLTQKEMDAISKSCTRRIVDAKTKEERYEVDRDALSRSMLEECVVYPNLKDAALQDSYGVCGAAVTSERCALGLRVMAAGKDYFTDKAPLTTLEQLEAAREMVRKTGRKYMVYYSERIHVEAAVFAGELIEKGAIGKPIHVDGFGPHRVGDPKSRPDWFFEKEKYGGILCDIGSHQIEQFLYYCGAKDAQVKYSQVGNYGHPDYPELEDFGDAVLVGDNGTTQHFRVDWFTPDGLSTWGDGRTFILGTEGYIELRKYVNVGTGNGTGDHVFLVNQDGEQHFEVAGKVGYPFFGQLILDCINRTENAMTQEHAFKAAELCVRAELQAVNLTAEK